MKSNEQLFIDHIKHVGPSEINIDWVIWMLEILDTANTDNIALDPEYLQADCRFIGDTEPPMFKG